VNVTRSSIWLGALVACCILSNAARAEVKKFLQVCDGKICPSYSLALTPPKGWEVDEAASKQNRVQMLVPHGRNFHNARAVIYVRVAPKSKDQPLSDFIRVIQERWRKSVPDTKISKLPVINRSNGQAAFEPFHYENPSRPQQAFEIVAFGTDSDKDGNDFIIMVVMSGRDQKALDEAQDIYEEFLRRH
jgi:hypothetical protein